jgi:hypothetical protein
MNTYPGHNKIYIGYLSLDIQDISLSLYRIRTYLEIYVCVCIGYLSLCIGDTYVYIHIWRYIRVCESIYRISLYI